MKRIFIYFFTALSFAMLVGCSMDNTPTKKVENYLNSYRNLDNNVIEQLDDIISTDLTMNDNQRTNYKEVIKRQYQDLNYTIKDEEVDGDKAVVTVEIEVYDYYKTNTESDNYYQTSPVEFQDESGILQEAKYIDYKIDRLDKTDEKVKYTIDFTLTKVDDTWILDDLSDTSRQKIHGLYAY